MHEMNHTFIAFLSCKGTDTVNLSQNLKSLILGFFTYLLQQIEYRISFGFEAAYATFSQNWTKFTMLGDISIALSATFLLWTHHVPQKNNGNNEELVTVI